MTAIVVIAIIQLLLLTLGRAKGITGRPAADRLHTDIPRSNDTLRTDDTPDTDNTQAGLSRENPTNKPKEPIDPGFPLGLRVALCGTLFPSSLCIALLTPSGIPHYALWVTAGTLFVLLGYLLQEGIIRFPQRQAAAILCHMTSIAFYLSAFIDTGMGMGQTVFTPVLLLAVVFFAALAVFLWNNYVKGDQPRYLNEGVLLYGFWIAVGVAFALELWQQAGASFMVTLAGLLLILAGETTRGAVLVGRRPVKSADLYFVPFFIGHMAVVYAGLFFLLSFPSA